MSTETKPSLNLYKKLMIYPSIWPERPDLKNQPGDLSKFAPHGNSVYGFEHFENNPIANAPRQEASGGVIYFNNNIPKSQFQVVTNTMGIGRNNLPKQFAVFMAESEKPSKEGYLTQMRVVSTFGLRHMYGALTEHDYGRFPDQKLTILDALWIFIEHERERWGTSWMQNKGLYGKFGGNGHGACEQLSFGFMVENSYHNIYRIWSRAWLVTK